MTENSAHIDLIMTQLNRKAISAWQSWSDLIIGWLTIFGTLIGGGAAIFQYIENSNSDRAKESLKFIERFQNEKIQDERKKLDLTLANNQKEIIDLYHNSKAELAAHLQTLINTEKIDIESIFDLYDQLHACVASKLCDEEISVRFFGKYAYDIVGTLYPYIDLVRTKSGDPLYGIGIQYFFDYYKKIN